mmetsp:Transcript_8739/g.27880  ORF Transcript_8739/g.27880 Transcript_8739/m.27880 type:complete len:277 (+) Transcript_8739:1624-2454(+)
MHEELATGEGNGARTGSVHPLCLGGGGVVVAELVRQSATPASPPCCSRSTSRASDKMAAASMGAAAVLPRMPPPSAPWGTCSPPTRTLMPRTLAQRVSCGCLGERHTTTRPTRGGGNDGGADGRPSSASRGVSTSGNIVGPAVGWRRSRRAGSGRPASTDAAAARQRDAVALRPVATTTSGTACGASACANCCMATARCAGACVPRRESSLRRCGSSLVNSSANRPNMSPPPPLALATSSLLILVTSSLMSSRCVGGREGGWASSLPETVQVKGVR